MPDHTFGILVKAWINAEAEARPEADLADLDKLQTIPNKKWEGQFVSEMLRYKLFQRNVS